MGSGPGRFGDIGGAACGVAGGSDMIRNMGRWGGVALVSAASLERGRQRRRGDDLRVLVSGAQGDEGGYGVNFRTSNAARSLRHCETWHGESRPGTYSAVVQSGTARTGGHVISALAFGPKLFLPYSESHKSHDLYLILFGRGGNFEACRSFP